MSDLHDDLATLTVGQPHQPADRLGAVTRRARRIRLTRVAASVTAALAVAVPAGAFLTSGAGTTPALPATSVGSWPDRSLAEDRGVAAGAVAQWNGGGEHDVAGLRWLFRGLVDVPGGDRSYVAVWRADGQVVAAYAPRTLVDDQGADANGPTAPGGSPSRPWLVFAAPDAGQRSLGVFLTRTEGESTLKNGLLVLSDPRARELDWTAGALPNAVPDPSARHSGRLSSGNGVFTGDAGALLGPLQVRIAGARGELLPAAPLSAVTAAQYLRPVVVTPPDLVADISGSGQFEAGLTGGQNSVGYAATPATSDSLYVRCYGGGQLELRLGTPGAVVARTPCDGETHAAFTHRRVTTAEGLVSVRGDRTQVWSFVLGRP